MNQYVKIATVTEIPEGHMKTIQVSGKKFTVANVDGEYFAVDDTCSHAQCSLGTEGFLDGNIVTCGCHGGQFDVTTGKVTALPPTVDINSYDIKVEGTDILMKI